MKILVATTLMAACFVGGMKWNSNLDDETQFVYQFEELETKRKETKNSYLPFLNVSSLHCGIYTLAAGGKDGQQPHSQDEIYYVEAGTAKINLLGKDYELKPGSIVFVPAKAQHHFHSIETDLKTLVFFSKGPIADKKPDDGEPN